ncbi:cyclic nucleotide-binding domain-containing protein [Devosia sp. ZB163]|uniref:Crp/Fnr family transcriptional regulator n=1 Tax=Devosia sp. ZB163 TaxID=3025938 RepID=UPI002360451E|nr:cyclic nucleotide-binding domain-containing protein [Devosia sp. ZB163]MDC9824310.1 cyclic nucleotide-binding domain-containing protein [Devosia sp. ZB163]
MTSDSSMQAVLAHTDDLAKFRYDTGDILISEGPPSGVLYILVEGAIEVLRGDVRVALVDEPGAVFGEISALLGGTHSATVRAVEPVTVHRIEDAVNFLQMRPEVVFHVARILARRLVDATTYLADIKHQYADRSDHLGMVDEVLEALVHQQQTTPAPDAAPTSDPRL